MIGSDWEVVSLLVTYPLLAAVIAAIVGFLHGRQRRGDVWTKPAAGKVVRVETWARSSDFEAVRKQAEADAAQVVRDNRPSHR